MGGYLGSIWSYQPQPNTQSQPVDQNKLRVMGNTVLQYLHLSKNKKVESIQRQEKELYLCITNQQRNRVTEFTCLQKIIQDYIYIGICEQTIQQVQIFINAIPAISQSQGDISKIQELIPYIINVLQNSQKLNIDALTNACEQAKEYFKESIKHIPQDQIVGDIGIRIPTGLEVNDFVIQFAHRHNLTLQLINSVGHQFEDFSNQNIYDYPMDSQEIHLENIADLPPFEELSKSQEEIHGQSKQQIGQVELIPGQNPYEKLL